MGFIEVPELSTDLSTLKVREGSEAFLQAKAWLTARSLELLEEARTRQAEVVRQAPRRALMDFLGLLLILKPVALAVGTALRAELAPDPESRALSLAAGLLSLIVISAFQRPVAELYRHLRGQPVDPAAVALLERLVGGGSGLEATNRFADARKLCDRISK